jgi:predicted dienelactone hydrolase
VLLGAAAMVVVWLPSRTVKPWERTADLSAILDYLATSPPQGLRPDMGRVGVMGFSLGGASALLVAGARLSKAAYLDHCARFAGQLECGWLTSNGLDRTTIDATRYEAPMPIRA